MLVLNHLYLGNTYTDKSKCTTLSNIVNFSEEQKNIPIDSITIDLPIVTQNAKSSLFRLPTSN